jgi:hypothetical protein
MRPGHSQSTRAGAIRLSGMTISRQGAAQARQAHGHRGILS